MAAQLFGAGTNSLATGFNGNSFELSNVVNSDEYPEDEPEDKVGEAVVRDPIKFKLDIWPESVKVSSARVAIFPARTSSLSEHYYDLKKAKLLFRICFTTISHSSYFLGFNFQIQYFEICSHFLQLFCIVKGKLP